MASSGIDEGPGQDALTRARVCEPVTITRHGKPAAVFRFMAETLTENPYRVTKPLTGQLVGYRSSSYVGISFRVIVTIDDANTVHVHRIAHRANAYRP